MIPIVAGAAAFLVYGATLIGTGMALSIGFWGGHKITDSVDEGIKARKNRKKAMKIASRLNKRFKEQGFDL